MGKGKLVFKGDNPKKKKKKCKHSHEESATVVVPALGQTSATNPDLPPSAVAASSTTNATATAAPQQPPPSAKQGTGLITTSGTVVTGHDTRFEKEIHPGDSIVVIGPDGQSEPRVVTMRLSNVSLNLSSAFTSNIKTPTDFQYVRKPRDIAKERRDASQRASQESTERQKNAYDLYGNDSLVYREKTETGSYRIKREAIDKSAQSRGDLLELRAKKTSDKYC
eukprot:Nitzschia sp. Nitz4//scaffold81_size91200//71451//72119//NITZ4_004997-RA/size91200-processed-gene-0.132-mRNA-1//-1//CDS//3329558743//1487//frame0